MSGTGFGASIRAGLASPLLPVWLVPALLPFGRSAELGVFLALVGAILLIVREPEAIRHHPGARLFLALFAAYALAALVSAIDAVAPGKSWGTVAGILRFAPLGVYTCFAMRRPDKVRALYRATAVVVAVWVADAWVQAVTGYGLAGASHPERLSGIFGDTNLKLGPALSALAPFLLWAARERWGRRGLVLAFLLALGPVLLSGSRASWLCYGIVALAFLWSEAGTFRRFAVACLGAGAAVALVAALAWQVSPRFRDRVAHTVPALSGTSAGIDAALTGRLDIWTTSLRLYAAHPVNGVGVRGFRVAYPAYAAPGDHFLTVEKCGDGEGACHAHQVLLEVATETGTLGLVAWLVAAILAARAWWRAGSEARRRAFPPTVALVAILFPLNTHMAFYSAWWGLLAAWLVSVWCAALFADLPDEAPVRAR
ncbi:O-antigen ligase [Luteibacter sp. UNC138MFCol5.1]|uniref:O-antigen ligase family protein n=1 Tax=Luteibacter sp. UNC138MFCol5.1 TaxID=1502774 RepID=UPI0008CBFD2B|nr:O-antigen ligase family protein [Luteibacter sp. UNC138MFCol5.1]SEO98477.1 O-antigen ligase [Luteibacter sp. UNC138MFCol5.1]